MTKIAPPNPGATFNERTGVWMIASLETHWSCPVHEFDANPGECDDCHVDEGPECLDCLFGERLVTFDEDGWATLELSWRRLFRTPGGWGSEPVNRAGVEPSL